MFITPHKPRGLRLTGALAFTAILLATGTASPTTAAERLKTATHLKAVYFVPMPNSGHVHAQLIMTVGEADATGPEGIAHYLEHLVQRHSLGDVNARPLHHGANATTNATATRYFRSGRPKHLERLIRELASVLDRPSQSRTAMLRERKVVIQEAILRTKENTTHRLRRSMARTMFGRHALARSIIGTPASIRRIEPAAALSFFDTYYNPANATLVVTGQASRADVIRLVDRYFARYAKGTPAKRTWRSASGWGPATTTIVKQNKLTRQPKVIIYQMFDVSALAKPDLLEALPMLRAILASSMPEGLESALIYDNYIASGLQFGLGLATDGWVQAAFHAVPADGIAPKRVAEAYFAALAKLNRSGISAATLKRAKRRAAKRYRRLFDRVSVRASHAAYWAANGITPPDLDAQIANTRRIKLAHINQLVAALASSRRTVIGYALPQHKGN